MNKFNFIQWTKFTPGPWILIEKDEPGYEPSNTLAIVDNEGYCITDVYNAGELCGDEDLRKQCIENGRIIAASPLMVSTLFDAYLMLQRLANKNVSNAIDSDSVRATLRNTLCEATGAGGQELQEFIEGLAFENPLPS